MLLSAWDSDDVVKFLNTHITQYSYDISKLYVTLLVIRDKVLFITLYLYEVILSV